MSTVDGNESQPFRPLLFSIAYRMLSSVADAEDIVQETYVRWQTVQRPVDSPKAYLTAITTRLCIDHLRSARVRRETYVGAWLPEPLLADGLDHGAHSALATTAAADPGDVVSEADSLSMAFLLILERLTPVERAVFLLHDVFDYDFAEVAHVVRRSPENCRQIGVRARRHVTENAPRFDASRTQRDELAQRFLAAFRNGDVAGLAESLAADVVVHGDGGGHRPSWPNAIAGRDNVTRLLQGLARNIATLDLTVDPTPVNGQPGAIIRTADGGIVNVITIDIADGLIHTIRSVINADKLGHLGPVADRDELYRRLR